MTANVSIASLTDGREVCLSYRVPVAVFVPGRGVLKTSRFYSVTSSKHANQYARKMTGREATVISHAEFVALVAPLECAG